MGYCDSSSHRHQSRPAFGNFPTKQIMRDETKPNIAFRLAEAPGDYIAFNQLVREYIAQLGFEVDFQDVDVELAEVQHRYGHDGRGAAILGITPTGEVVGIAGLRDLGGQACELKRMYVKPAHRNGGIGKRLCEEAVSIARRLGYHTIRLDSLDRMESAKRLYEAQGFRPISPYTTNPMPDAKFYELRINECG